MKRAILIPGLIISLFVNGCGGNEKVNSVKQSDATDTLEKKPKTSYDSKEDVSGKVVLNNGDKWEANEQTLVGIRKMKEMVNDFLVISDNNNVEVLGDNLKTEFSDILEKCTMTGEAHDQLHNYLLPLKDKIKKLKDNQDIASVKEVQIYLDEFEKYFH